MRSAPSYRTRPCPFPLTSLQILDCALSALQILNASDFAQVSDGFLQPYKEMTAFSGPTFDLPSILVPPEVVELDSLSTDSGEDALVKKEEWPEFHMRLFDNDASSWYILRRYYLTKFDRLRQILRHQRAMPCVARY